jgi:hypothetical protein
MRSKVAAHLPPKNFALRFRFDYDMIQGSESESRRLESYLMRLIEVAHFELHGNKVKRCGIDLIYVP